MKWLAAMALAPLLVLAQRAPTFRLTTTRVAVDAAVLDHNTPVTGLTAADFVLTDNGVAQHVDQVGLSDVPVDVSLVVDVSGSTEAELQADRRDVAAIATTLRLIDRLRLIEFSATVREILPLTPAGTPPPVDRLETGGLSSVYDGIAAALLRRVDPGRRHLIVAYTDGLENRGILTSHQLWSIAQSSEAVLHLVAPGSVPFVFEIHERCTKGPASHAVVPGFGFGDVPCSDDPVLARAVEATGGAVHLGTHMADTFHRIFMDFTNSYVLYFQPRGVAASGWHELSVRVSRGKYTVHARRGYFVGGA